MRRSAAQHHHGGAARDRRPAAARPGSATCANSPHSDDARFGHGVVWRFAACTTLIVLAFAMAAPVMAVSLQQAGYSTAAVGAFAMIPFALIAVLIPVMPTVLARWGIVRAYQWGSLLQLGGALGYAAGDSLGVWSAASVASGMGAAALWNATEALLAREAPPERRGRVMGLYQTSLGAALALGPFVPALLGWGARPVLWAAAVVVVACCAIALAIPRTRRANRRPTRKAGPGTPCARCRCWPDSVHGGVFEAGLGSVSAAYASGTGLGLSARRQRGRRHRGGQLPLPVSGGRRGRQVQGAQRIFIAAALLLLAASLAFARSAAHLGCCGWWAWSGAAWAARSTRSP